MQTLDESPGVSVTECWQKKFCGNLGSRGEFEQRHQQNEAFLSSVLKSLNDELVVVGKTGVILAMSGGWERWARENGIDPATVSRGVNYLEVCRRASAAGDASAGQALEAIKAVMSGSREQMCLEYSCASRMVSRWFIMKVTPFRAREGSVVIVHADVTQLKEVRESLRRALAEVERLKQKVQEADAPPQRQARSDNGHQRIVGQSQAIRRVLAQAEEVARTDSTVLLLGETGTGKDLLAACLHELSSRRDRAMVSVNCAGMPAALVESELFGREKGAFTGSLSRQVGRFELADGSTIFLDEVGELSCEVQAKLLRVLEARQIERLGNPKPIAVNVRIIAATNQNLHKAVEDGRFRQDLYYRLNVFPITVPPLRERREDIPLLVWAFVDEFAKKFNKDVDSIARESMDALQRYTWPGNIRELRNVVERAMIVATGQHLRIQLPRAPATFASPSNRKIRDVEREHILSILEESGWRIRGIGGAAAKLGLKPTTLEARMAKLGLGRPSRVSGD